MNTTVTLSIPVVEELLDTCLLLFVCNCVAFLCRTGFAQALGALPKFFLQTKLKEVGFSFLGVFVCLVFLSLSEFILIVQIR